MKQQSTRRWLFQFISIVVALALMLPVAALAAPAPTIAPAAPHAEPDAPESGTISGTVFRDYNADGTQQTNYAVAPNIVEPGMAGVIVTAYDVNNAVAGTTTSGANGLYSFTATNPTSAFRVEFTLPADTSLDFLQAGKAGSTTTVFVPTGGQTGLNVGFNNPADYSQTNPPLVTTRTAFGPRLGGGGESALPAWSSGASVNANESVIGVAYTASGDLANSNAHNVYATLKQTGTLYGLIYQRKAKLILAGTFFKSFADTGPKLTGQSGNYAWLNDVDPLGAIYAVQPTPLASNPPDIPAATNAKVYANLNKIIDPGTGLQVPGNPAGTDPRRDTAATINYDSGSFGDCNGGGTGGAPADGSTCWRHDPVAFMKVGTIGLGDLEEDDTEQTAFVVNLGDKKLYQLPIDTNPSNWPITTLAASPVAIPANGCSNNEAIPGALGFNDGKVYVGVTCTAKTSQLLSDLKALVYEFNPKTNTFNTTPVFSAALDYPRGCIFTGYGTNETGLQGQGAYKNNLTNSGGSSLGILTGNCQSYKDANTASTPDEASPQAWDSANWKPWPQTWQAVFENNQGINSYGKPGQANADMVQIEHAVPWLSDISFDGNDLVLGLRDTNGDRMGNLVRSPNITTNTGVPAENNVADYFNSQAYNNNNGDNNWGASWTESGEATNATAGDIQVLNNVSNYQLRLQGSGSVKSIQRTAYTGFGTTTGTLSFAYRRVGMEAGDQVTVEISNGGAGGPWTIVATLAGPTNDGAYRTGIYDISLTSATIVRFSTNAAMASDDQVWLDHIRITNGNRNWMSQYVYGSPNNVFTGAAFGDLLRACWNGTGWTLENNGACGGVTTPGKDNGQGPSTAGTYPNNPSSPFTGYGEWYWDDSGPGSRNPATAIEYFNNNLNYRGHEQTMMGGTYQMPGWPDIAVTIADQAGFGDGGVARFSNVVDHPNVTLTGGNLVTAFGATPTFPIVLSNSTADPNDNDAGVSLGHTQLYTAVAGFFGKANGMGDIEALSNSAPLEIGNRLWCDNGVGGVGAYNGIQDPGEAGANNVVVRLTCGTEYAEVTTSGSGLAAGSYLFTDAIWDASANAAGIIPRNTQCTISVATTGANATALNNACGGTTLKVPTVPNAQGNATNNPLQDIRDSDATAVRTAGAVTSAQISFLTGGPGVNNHGLDFGFNAEADYGDAPDPTYPTLAASNGANHTIVSGIRMGALIDSEQDGQPNAAATGDDLATSDDEDGVTFSALAAGQPAVASVNMTGLTGTPVCRLNAWIDFNGNGSWLDAGEQIATNVALNGGAVVPVPFNVPAAVTTSPTYARFRCSTQTGLAPTGPASDGEVEDYRVTIEQNASLDYGDAPDPTYPTFSASGGASHVLGTAGPRLGACVDAEANGQPNGTATGDDLAVGAPMFGTCANNDDEDGVTIPPLMEGVITVLAVNVSNAACVLNAWIDFNGDGDWNDAGEQIATNQGPILGNNIPVQVTPPAAATQAPTFARFRCSTQTGLGPTGAAADGEVEDYTLTIAAGSASNDWGDAPDTGTGTSTGNYQTVGTDNGAHHLMVANVFLGACVDPEADGQPIAGATGDDNNATTPRFGTCAAGNDDEDGMTIPTLLAGQTAQLVASRVATTACYLNGWIDFNADGDWIDTGEQVATNVLLAAGNNNLAVNVPGGAAAGTTYARFRCSTQQNLNPVGVASDGEVEDYAVTVTGSASDWGDLPDTPYPTLAGSNGAVHVLSSSAFMGKCVDAETNGQPNSGATLDDTSVSATRLGLCAAGDDDEDGVTFTTLPLNAGSTETASVDMSAFNQGAQVCFLNAWIDFNGNGSLTDAGEQIATNVQMIGGAALNVVNFTVPSVVTAAATGARFRCSTQPGLAPTGSASNGEVEDYMVTITQQDRDFGDAPDGSVGTGVGNYNTTISDNGPSHLIVANLRLGALAPDADNGTLQDVPATADDLNNTDDEDGVLTLPVVKTTSTSVAMNVSVFNNRGSASTVACWIDFNRDGVFGSAERASASVTSNAAQQPNIGLTFSGFSTPVAGISYLRCRVATAAGEVASPTGPADTGEVEDYQITITQDLDFGDLPDTFGTLSASNGPRHTLSANLLLGACVDSEANGQPDPFAGMITASTGDDGNQAGAPGSTLPVGVNCTDDENGVTLVTPLVAGGQACVAVTAINTTGGPANLWGWIDFNGDGVFTAAEALAGGVGGTGGNFSGGVATIINGYTGSNPATNQFCFQVPTGATFTGGDTHMRFRLTTDTLSTSAWVGAASNGEVEDYYSQLACVGNLVWSDSTPKNGVQDAGELGIDGITVYLVWAGPNNTIDTLDGSTVASPDDMIYSTATVGGGKYQFCGIVPGKYQLKVVTLPAGLPNAATPNLGTSDFKDSDGAQSGGAGNPSVIPAFTIASVTGQPTAEDGLSDGSPINSFPDAQENRSYDFGFSATPTAVTLRTLQAAPQSPWEAALELLRLLAQPAAR